MTISKAMPPYNNEMPGKQDTNSSQQAASTMDFQTSVAQQDILSAASVSPMPTHNPSIPEVRYNPQNLNSSVPNHMSTEASATALHPQQQVPDWTMSEAMPNSSSAHFHIEQSAMHQTIQIRESTMKEKLSTTTKKRQSSKVQQVGPKRAAVTSRRQKRLERNRESARLSRRRRKQYLEVLEDRVRNLSVEMDKGRREHAENAIGILVKKRKDAILNTSFPIEAIISKLDSGLSRTSSELSVLSTFYVQQLKSLSLPPHSSFIFWLTLQGDAYFRGGRSASERLSAARIGERMLLGGNDKVTPVNSMWPLVCNEIGLSYDQEERVRNFQRSLLQTPSTWLDRHTSRATGLVAASFDSSFKTVTQSVRKREQSIASELRPEQRLKFARWAEQSSERIRRHLEAKRGHLAKKNPTKDFELSSSHHTSANLYILNYRLRKVIGSLPKNLISFNATSLKRLSRRPSFESLGQQKEDPGDNLTREGSFASSGSLKSLKRSSSSLSMDDPDRPQSHQIHPEERQREAESLVKKELGFVESIIPPSVGSTPLPKGIPAPLSPVLSSPGYTGTNSYITQKSLAMENASSNSHQHENTIQYRSTMPAHPVSTAMQRQQFSTTISTQQQLYQQLQQTQSADSNTDNATHSYQNLHAGELQPEVQSQPGKVHKRKTSFLPLHLHAVPEEEFTSGEGGADDFFMSLIDDEDWAIGEGVDMDPTT